MKKYLVFTALFLLSINNPVQSCVFWPLGEELRFRLVDPDHWGYDGFRLYHYSADYYYSSNGMWGDNLSHLARYNRDERENLMWYKTVSGTDADLEEICDVVYSSHLRIKNKNSSNRFIRSLQKPENRGLRSYLEFARSCNAFNSYNQDDPWERQAENLMKGRQKKLKEALKLASKEHDLNLRARYAFLALRLAYYAGDFKSLNEIFNEYFKERVDNRDVVWYWAYYFYTALQPLSAETNYHAAQIFLNSVEKRRNVRYSFTDSIPDSECIRFCKNNIERSAFSLIRAVRNPKEGLTEMKEFYRLNPKGEELGFLLLREINKLEDWILTPKYLGYLPALWHLRDTSYKWYDNQLRQINIRVERDKQYARELLQFLSGVESNIVKDPVLFKMSAAYLHFLLDNKSEAAELIDQCLVVEKDSVRRIDLETLRTLFLVSRDVKETNPFAKVNTEVLFGNNTAQNKRLCFGLGRELELNGQSSLAALMFQKVNPDDRKGYWYNDNTVIFHKPSKAGKYTWVDFNANYFLYLDSQYSAEQIDMLIKDVQRYTTLKDAFFNQLAKGVFKDIQRMYDLAGTKYLRLDMLNQALERFAMVNDTLWESDLYPYKDYLNANPFHADFYSEHRPTKFDTIRFSKRTLLETMLAYKSLADSVTHPHRDYYAFLVGNAYLNMTFYGNSWLMRRYYWSSSMPEYGFDDDEEFYSAQLAKKYYEIAFETARNKDFKVLALRMAGRCEKYALQFKLSPDWSYDGDFENDVFQANKTYKRIANEFPDYYEDVMSNCSSFSQLFKSRLSYGKHR